MTRVWWQGPTRIPARVLREAADALRLAADLSITGEAYGFDRTLEIAGAEPGSQVAAVCSAALDIAHKLGAYVGEHPWAMCTLEAAALLDEGLIR